MGCTVELLTYFGSSVVMAAMFLPGLGRYDGPPISNHLLERTLLGPMPYPYKLDLLHVNGMRRMLSGSLFRAGWMLTCWGGVGVLFFGGESKIEGTLPAILFAFPNGFALAIAIYNIRKYLRRS
jgi:hypothetical protein